MGELVPMCVMCAVAAAIGYLWGSKGDVRDAREQFESYKLGFHEGRHYERANPNGIRTIDLDKEGE